MRKITGVILMVALAQLGATATKENQNSAGVMPATLGENISRFFSQKKSSKNTSSKSNTSNTNQSTEAVGNSGGDAGATVATGVNQIKTKVPVTASVLPSLTKNTVSVQTPVLNKTYASFNLPAVSSPVGIARVNQAPRAPSPVGVIKIDQTSQIRQEMQRIIDINNQIKQLQAAKTFQFQRFQELAKVRQQILAEKKDKNAKNQKNSEAAPNKNSLLEQEKLRMIHETAQDNKAKNTSDSKVRP